MFSRRIYRSAMPTGYNEAQQTVRTKEFFGSEDEARRKLSLQRGQVQAELSR